MDAGGDQADGGGGDRGAAFAYACEFNRRNPCYVSLVSFPSSIEFMFRRMQVRMKKTEEAEMMEQDSLMLVS